MTSRNSRRQGFGSMDPQRQREISRQGGRASHGGRGRQENDDYEDEYDDDYEQTSARGGYEDDYEDEDGDRQSSGRGGYEDE